MRVAVSYAFPILLFPLIFGSSGLWLAALLFTMSTLLLVVALVVSLLCAEQITRKPALWSGAAVIVAEIFALAVLGWPAMVFAAAIAVPGMITFLIGYRIWPADIEGVA